MSRHTRSKRNRRWRGAQARGRNRVVGLTGAAGAALAFGIGPLAAAPPASADEFDAIIDAVAASIAGLGDPVIGADLSTLGASSAEPLAALGLSADAMSAAGSWDALLHTLEQDWITSSLGSG